MKKNILILSAIILFSSNSIIFAGNNVNSKLEKTYNQFILKLEKKFNSLEQELFIKRISLKIENILEKNNLSKEKRNLINDLDKLLNETLYSFYLKKVSFNEKQKILEKQYFNKLNQELKPPLLPNYIKNMISKGINFIIVNGKYEFINAGYIKKIIFSNYYKLDSSNYNNFIHNKGYIIYNINTKKYLFIKNYEIVNKIPYSESAKYFKFHLTNKNNIFNEYGSFYTYNIPSFLFINDKYGFYIDSLNRAGIDNTKFGIHRNNSGKYTFIKDYTKINLIEESIVYGIPEKEKFLDNIKNDKKIIIENTNNDFAELKETTNNLTKGLTKDEKIKAIYAWILENIEYSKDFTLDDYKIYSGILTYKNKEGVCEGYAKLMAYMLNLSGIKNVEVLRGKVIDAQDFPTVGHAWLKIGDLYYDPTFDDPIGTKKAKNFNNYKYYALPKDLFYTNRFDLNQTPKSIETSDIEYRKSLISQNLYNLSDKYLNNNFLILNDSIFRKKYSISPDEIITIDTLVEILPMYNVDNYIFIERGKKKHISNITYFILTNDNINDILFQLNFDLAGRYFFKWKNKDGTFKYIISDTISIN